MRLGSLALDWWTPRIRAVDVRLQIQSESGTTWDYVLRDPAGQILGTIALARENPIVGKNAPTVLLKKA
jgi:hypothetical protein